MRVGDDNNFFTQSVALLPMVNECKSNRYFYVSLQKRTFFCIWTSGGKYRIFAVQERRAARLSSYFVDFQSYFFGRNAAKKGLKSFFQSPTSEKTSPTFFIFLPTFAFLFPISGRRRKFMFF